MDGKIKQNDFIRRVHPEFWDLVERIQEQRITEGTEKVKNKTSKSRLTKTIANYINSHPEAFDMIIKVKINGN